VISTAGIGPSALQSRSASFQICAPPRSRSGGEGGHVVADEHDRRADHAAHACDERRRGAIVDRHDDHARQQAAPIADHPLGTVLAPHHDLVDLFQTRAGEPRGESARRASDIFVCMRAVPVAVVEDEKVAAQPDDVGKKVD
jgi:hypothetical protein